MKFLEWDRKDGEYETINLSSIPLKTGTFLKLIYIYSLKYVFLIAEERSLYDNNFLVLEVVK